MKAALYARKSTDDSDKHEDNRSVARQIERARAFCAARDWTVAEDHIYADDGVSGAEYQHRPGLLRLMAHLQEFDVVVMSEISRLGRDMVRNAVVIDELRGAGVQLWYYLTAEQEQADTPEQRIMVTLRSFAAEVERAKASQRTRDALERKALRGENAGGSTGTATCGSWTTAAGSSRRGARRSPRRSLAPNMRSTRRRPGSCAASSARTRTATGRAPSPGH